MWMCIGKDLEFLFFSFLNLFRSHRIKYTRRCIFYALRITFDADADAVAVVVVRIVVVVFVAAAVAAAAAATHTRMENY